jgi:calcyphosin
VSFVSLFRVMDDDGNRKLSMEEFQKGVEEYGLHFDRPMIAELFRAMDIDHNGSIDYEEFLRRLRVSCFVRLLLIQFQFDLL